MNIDGSPVWIEASDLIIKLSERAEIVKKEMDAVIAAGQLGFVHAATISALYHVVSAVDALKKEHQQMLGKK